jgi:hypothetical protein
VSVGAAALVGTVIYYFVDSKEPAGGAAKKAQQPRVTFMPVYEQGYTGGIVSGRF